MHFLFMMKTELRQWQNRTIYHIFCDNERMNWSLKHLWSTKTSKETKREEKLGLEPPGQQMAEASNFQGQHTVIWRVCVKTSTKETVSTDITYGHQFWHLCPFFSSWNTNILMCPCYMWACQLICFQWCSEDVAGLCCKPGYKILTLSEQSLHICP